MARINIEDSLFKDPRYLDLLIACGCRYKALGLVTSAWIIAQQNWIAHKSIPHKAWSDQLNLLIQYELAERLENGHIYVKGSKKAFGWLEQKVEAGRIGGLKKQQNKTKKASGRLAGASGTLANGSENYPHTHSLTHTQSQVINEEVSSLHPLIEIWNGAKNLSKVKVSNKERDAKINKVWSRITPDQWKEVVRKMDASDFLTGKTIGKDGRSFKATFDFFIKPETYLKVLEGQYDNGTSNKGQYGHLRDSQTVGNEFNDLLADISSGRAYGR